MRERAPCRRLLALCVVTMLISAAGATETPTVAEVVEKVQARIDATSDFTARVRQELVLSAAGRSLAAEGTVAFKRPGRMRWELDGDEKQIIVADGSTLWFYQPEDLQVIKSPFETAFRSRTPVSFLTGVGRIQEDFDASLDGVDGELLILALRPRAGAEEIGRLRLMVEPGTYEIMVAEITDPLGNLTRLRFSDRRRNVGLNESLFRFEVPSNVDVIEAPVGPGDAP